MNEHDALLAEIESLKKDRDRYREIVNAAKTWWENVGRWEQPDYIRTTRPDWVLKAMDTDNAVHQR